MLMLARVSSAMPTTETSDEAFRRSMNSLINGGADIGTGALTITAGSAGSSVSDAPANAGNSAAVNEGDVINFTPSGASGAGIPANFHAVIRES